MANALQKLIRKPSYQRIITCFNHQKPPDVVAPPSLYQFQISQTKLEDNKHNLNPILCSPTNEKLTHHHPLQIYPSFPFGYCLNPISPSGFDPSHPLKAEWVESDESRMVWADSVKKKRKKKMNKHKYKKLRKSLRRQT
ncbi:hypothetical protein L1049_006914 [Liquidambar formosana]|uniref:Small ribosomal subunit protein mS38 n=1 Tax=Liquidambar formosana TaxID=63359 RepID=A0AAP0RGB1_LIQFO